MKHVAHPHHVREHLGKETLEEMFRRAGGLIINIEGSARFSEGKSLARRLAQDLKTALTQIIDVAERSNEKPGIEYCNVFIGGLEALGRLGIRNFKDPRLLKQAAEGIKDPEDKLRARWGIIRELLGEPIKPSEVGPKDIFDV